MPNFVKRRIKKKIDVKIISDSIPYDKKAKYKILNSEIKTATWIYGGRIIMVSLEKDQLIGVLIEEKNFYKTQEMMFDFLWDNI